MASSPETKPRISTTTDFEDEQMRPASADPRRNRMENKPDNTIGYVIGVIAMLVVGYFAYVFFGQNNVTPSITDQSTTTVAPPVTPPPATPVEPPAATTPEPPATTPVQPATPPAGTTTP